MRVGAPECREASDAGAASAASSAALPRVWSQRTQTKFSASPPPAVPVLHVEDHRERQDNRQRQQSQDNQTRDGEQSLRGGPTFPWEGGSIQAVGGVEPLGRCRSRATPARQSARSVSIHAGIVQPSVRVGPGGFWDGRRTKASLGLTSPAQPVLLGVPT